ncbi:TorF family putative porin [Acinetobacter junii]|uniref:TorF family putative porin n=1 Tax=Acinetobacter junii TaxID=40215 RepID=UPI0034CFD7F9
MQFSQFVKPAVLAFISIYSLSTYAGLTGNVGVVSDYYARGLDQTGGVSVQGSIDYSHSSGFYLGSFASNVKWYDKTGDGVNDSDIEWDFYTGYNSKLSDNLGFDVGLYFLNYPNQTKFTLYTTNFTEPLSYQDSAFLKLPKFP